MKQEPFKIQSEMLNHAIKMNKYYLLNDREGKKRKEANEPGKIFLPVNRQIP